MYTRKCKPNPYVGRSEKPCWQEYSTTKQEISRRSFCARHVRLATSHILLFGAFWVLAPAGDHCHCSNFTSFNERMVCPADVWQIWNSRSSFDKKTMCFGLVLRLSSCNLEQRAKRLLRYARAGQTCAWTLLKFNQFFFSFCLICLALCSSLWQELKN